ncbi:universal stress protein [Thermoleophilum album]|uniref:universal stress protein n=1 Tax=Thermoleophilum album TaxID=29539 RepID=UPI00237CEBF7|nr:universal stress protein [Thermoleophilum album]WDT92925.1 universal stress protein [Thermoleophilum album]
MARFRPRSVGLERVLGAGALFSTAYGNVGSSIYYALGLVAVFALGLTPAVFVIAGLIFACTAATYAEGTTMYPEAGGSSSFARHAFNELWAFVAAWGQMLNYIITVAISAFFVPHYLGVFWPELGRSPADIVAGIAVIAVLAAINVIGVKESARMNVILAVTDFLTQVALVVAGLVLVFSPEVLVRNVDFGRNPTLGDFLVAIPVGMVAYTGIETISNMAEEARDYGRTIPRGIAAVVAAVFAIYAFLPAVALSAMPVDNGRTLLALSKEEGGFADDPVLGIVENMHLGVLQRPAEIYVGLLAATILFLATNAGLIGVSRLTYSMGQYRQLPQKLRSLHPRFRTPYVAIVTFSLIACATLLPGEAEFLGTIYAFGAMLSFTIAHVAVATLRVRAPEVERPWRGPGTLRVRGHELPVYAVVGGIGTGLALVVVSALDLRTLAVGSVWLAVGLALYVAYRKGQGLGLTETRKIVLPEPVVEREVEYESILVAFDGGQFEPEAVRTACKLAARRNRAVHVLVLITVPYNLPIDAAMPAEEEAAQTVIDSARVIGGRRVTGHWEKVRPGGAGRRIVDEARAIKARAVVMPVPSRRAGGGFGNTIETVLAERPGRVILVSPRPAQRDLQRAA